MTRFMPPQKEITKWTKLPLKRDVLFFLCRNDRFTDTIIASFNELR